ncbi:MAG: tetratricopeptide repeat protein [Alphaproteobacteria bacterium]
MAEHVEDGLLREIDEEIRHENFAKLWKKYGTIIIAAAIVLVASVAGYKAWQGYDLKERSRQGVEFASALNMAADNKAAEALEVLSQLETTSGAGYAMLSQFQGARLQAAEGNARIAADIYDRISADSATEPLYSGLAVILATIQRMNMKAVDTAALTTRLGPLGADDNAWRYSARELMAVLAVQSGDRPKARELLTALRADRNTPAGINRRATEMLAALAE